VIDRFSAGRMTDGYEAIYRTMIDAAAGAGEGEGANEGPEAHGQGGDEPRPLKPVMASDLAASGRAS
jgi:hypothetical protein